MRLGKWEFRSNLWPSMAATLLLPLLIGLGFWQLDRAEQKQGLEQVYAARQASPPVDLAAEPYPGGAALLWRRARLRGGYLTSEQYLLDNQVIDGKAGYFVYTPFRLEGRDTVVLVNRGWIAMDGGRDAVPAVPAPANDGVVEGTIKPPQSTGLDLSGGAMEELGRGLVRVADLNPQAVAERNGWQVLPRVVRMDNDGGGLVRDWQAPGFGRQRHLGYAFQWFAMATALVVIYLVVNTRRRMDHE